MMKLRSVGIDQDYNSTHLQRLDMKYGSYFKLDVFIKKSKSKSKPVLTNDHSHHTECMNSIFGRNRLY